MEKILKRLLNPRKKQKRNVFLITTLALMLVSGSFDQLQAAGNGSNTSTEQQTGTQIKGKVTDVKGLPLPGAIRMEILVF
jgi:hypothetical protein